MLQNRTRFTSYDHTDGVTTVFGGINSSNMICGYYSDGTTQHAFVARLGH
ncbi:MAG: hypothetical protein ABI217_03720 [Chthoniobacterales bacterium]